MNWLDKLERKFGRFAIPNLTVYLLVGYVIGFGIMFLMPEMLGYLTLEPALILRGQIWRIISWVLIPPTTNLISLVFLVLLYYSLGTALESCACGIRYVCLLLFCTWSGSDAVEREPDQHKLYYDVYIPGICCNLSGYGSFALFHTAD